jgi:exodeoxyribonuclease VII large subunit
MEAENSALTIYSPAAILNLFNNSIPINQIRRIVQLKGVYVQGKGNHYSGYYYDTFRDEASDAICPDPSPPL